MNRSDDAPGNQIRILPGQWRPQYVWEQIAWIQPPWSKGYVWLDFPEAIFADNGLLYLSHNNPKYTPLFPDLPHVEWQRDEDGMRFERTLPNGVAFGGALKSAAPSRVAMELFIRNDSPLSLRQIRIQTCLFLRPAPEFADETLQNKLVHVKDRGWISLDKAMLLPDGGGTYRLGWRGGPAVADRPIVVTISREAERLIAMTWDAQTHALIGNPRHPCMHADPAVNDLAPGKECLLRGDIIFFTGSLNQFDLYARK